MNSLVLVKEMFPALIAAFIIVAFLSLAIAEVRKPR